MKQFQEEIEHRVTTLYPPVCVLQAAALDRRWMDRLSQRSLESEYVTATPMYPNES